MWFPGRSVATKEEEVGDGRAGWEGIGKMGCWLLPLVFPLEFVLLGGAPDTTSKRSNQRRKGGTLAFYSRR